MEIDFSPFVADFNGKVRGVCTTPDFQNNLKLEIESIHTLVCFLNINNAFKIRYRAYEITDRAEL